MGQLENTKDSYYISVKLDLKDYLYLRNLADMLSISPSLMMVKMLRYYGYKHSDNDNVEDLVIVK